MFNADAIKHSYKLLHLVHKANSVEKKERKNENKQQTHARTQAIFLVITRFLI